MDTLYSAQLKPYAKNLSAYTVISFDTRAKPCASSSGTIITLDSQMAMGPVANRVTELAAAGAFAIPVVGNPGPNTIGNPEGV